jgi:hypothetical protein
MARSILFTLAVFLLALPAAFAGTPEQERAQLYQPWAAPLTDLAKSFKPGRNYVAWIMVPPHFALDLRSGNDFRKNYLSIPPSDFSISHNLVAWQCTRKDGTAAQGAMAISGENSGQSKTMLKTGLGLTMLFSNFTDGFLEGPAHVTKVLNRERKYEGAAIVAFEVSGDDCENMLQFVDAFSLDPKRPYQNFSNLKDPDKFEGGGCVTLAKSLLQRAGILTTLWPHVSRTFHVNKLLLGGNVPLPRNVSAPNWPWLNGKPKNVPLLEVLTFPWDASEQNSVELDLMDPELMLYSLRAIALEYLRTVPAAKQAAEEKAFDNSAFGARSVQVAVGPFIDPKDDYIHAHKLVPLNDAFDPAEAQVARLARDWFANAEHEGFEARRANVGNYPALIVDKK